jgi:hypothetical protein
VQKVAQPIGSPDDRKLNALATGVDTSGDEAPALQNMMQKGNFFLREIWWCHLRVQRPNGLRKSRRHSDALASRVGLPPAFELLSDIQADFAYLVSFIVSVIITDGQDPFEPEA